jgi:hypothetical protein
VFIIDRINFLCGSHFRRLSVISTNSHPGIREFATALLKTVGRAMRSAVCAVCTLKSVGHFRERLLTLSDREYMFTYTILESPLPMTD